MIKTFAMLAVLMAVCAGGCAVAGDPVPVKRSAGTGPLRVAVIGMTHGHVHGVLSRARDAKDVEIVGVWEPKREVFEKLAKQYTLDPGLWRENLGEMLDACKPEAVSVMTSIADHRMAVEACAPRGVHLLLEKPLAYERDDAEAMASLGREHGVLVLTNFETSWYASVRTAKEKVASGEIGAVRKMVFRHGHRGPKEIGCSPEFLEWLTDPVGNGGGAVVDFGCYGAVLATWMMDGREPTGVTASTAQLKAAVYPKVDDDATIVLTYEGAVGGTTAVIQASWAWTHDNKEMDVFGEKGSISCGKWDDLWTREPDREMKKAPVSAREHENEWVYLRRVVRGECAVDPLSSVEFNVTVAGILEKARTGTGH